MKRRNAMHSLPRMFQFATQIRFNFIYISIAAYTLHTHVSSTIFDLRLSFHYDDADVHVKYVAELKVVKTNIPINNLIKINNKNENDEETCCTIYGGNVSPSK